MDKTGASKILRNIFVPPTFVQADGKNFGDMVKEKLVTYGDEWKDVNLADAQDGLYNPEKAKAEFAKAKNCSSGRRSTVPNSPRHAS